MNLQPHILVAALALLLGTASAQTSGRPPTDTPPPASPIAYFRQLLVMSETERTEELAHRPDSQRAGLQAKIKEYTAMSATERELRLRATELRYYLLPMMKMSEAEQEQHLPSVPDDIRELVSDRLTQWRLIPPPYRQQLVDKQATLQLFSRLNPTSASTADELVDELQLTQLSGLEQDYERWRALPEGQRNQLLRGFNHFFQLTAPEKQRTLRTLSPEERRALESTLAKYETLSPAQRFACVQGFQQFLLMPPDERAVFLKNADRWQAMSPEDREAWRTVVNQLSEIPPLPPGVEPILIANTPPLPPGFNPATNQRTH